MKIIKIASTPYPAPMANDANQANSPLLQLPAELRNEIFELALTDQNTINTGTRWPGITGACKQLRAETLTLYLENVFEVHIIDLNDKPFAAWLRAVQGLSGNAKELIESVTIFCEGNVLGLSDPHCAPFSNPRPNFDFYNNLILNIKSAGLTSKQIIWPGLDKTYLSPFNIARRRAKCCQIHLLYQFVLPPLLNLHQGGTSPPDVYDQVVRGREALGLAPGFYLYWRDIAAITKSSNPGGWFGEWEWEDVEDDAVEEEKVEET